MNRLHNPFAVAVCEHGCPEDMEGPSVAALEPGACGRGDHRAVVAAEVAVAWLPYPGGIDQVDSGQSGLGTPARRSVAAAEAHRQVDVRGGVVPEHILR